MDICMFNDSSKKETGVLNGGMSNFFRTDNQDSKPFKETIMANSGGSLISMKVVSDDVFGEFLKKVVTN